MKAVLFCLIFAAALLLCQAMRPGEKTTYISLQPEKIKVLKYTIIFQVDLKNTLAYYTSIVRIKYQCIQQTNIIFLSRKELNMSDNPPHLYIDRLSSGTNVEIISNEDYLDTDSDWYPIVFNTLLDEGGTYELRLGFDKPAAYKFSPFVRYNYIRENQEKTLALTKSGAASAKELFFCFDNVKMKAQYEVLIMHNDGTKSFGNMPSNTRQLGENWVEDQYEVSELMPTFSFGFVIGDFQTEEYKDESLSTVIRVSSDKSVLEQMKFAGQMALKVFLFYTKHFQFNYAAKKLDIIALPDYDRIERENYGFIAIGESIIMNPNPVATLSNTSTVLYLCDAIAFQWIGYQTTTFQLNEYWLNKGLILFFQAHCLNEIYPGTGMKFWNSYIVKSFARVLDSSVKVTSRPMSVSEDRVHLNTLFSDHYLAEKAHHIIRMMNFIVGSSTFQEKFITFFKNHQMANTNLQEVWRLFDTERDDGAQSSTDITIRRIMNSWITKHGFPTVYVQRSGKKIILKQERFLSLGDSNTNYDRIKDWIFPFSFTTQSEKNFNDVQIDYWLESRESSFQPRNKIQSSDWIIYNGNLNVPCRIHYERKNWESLQSTLLKSTQYYWIAPEARARLMFDMFALAENGKFVDSYKLPLKTLKYLQHETSHMAWLAAMHEVNKILLKLRNTAELQVYKEYISKILDPVFARDQFKTITHIPEDDDERNFKKLIITSACSVGVTACVEQCRALFNEWKENVENGENNNPIPVAIRDVVSCQAIKHGSKVEWNFLWEEQLKEENILVKREMYEALGCTNNLDRLEDYMDYWIEKDKIHPRDFEVVFNSFLSSEAGYLRMKKVFIERLEDLIKNHGEHKTLEHKTLGYKISLYYVKILEVTKNQMDIKHLTDAVKAWIDSDSDNYWKIRTALSEGSKKAERNIMWLAKHRSTFSKIEFKFES